MGVEIFLFLGVSLCSVRVGPLDGTVKRFSGVPHRGGVLQISAIHFWGLDTWYQCYASWLLVGGVVHQTRNKTPILPPTSWTDFRSVHQNSIQHSIQLYHNPSNVRFSVHHTHCVCWVWAQQPLSLICTVQHLRRMSTCWTRRARSTAALFISARIDSSRAHATAAFTESPLLSRPSSCHRPSFSQSEVKAPRTNYNRSSRQIGGLQVAEISALLREPRE